MPCVVRSPTPSIYTSHDDFLPPLYGQSIGIIRLHLQHGVLFECAINNHAVSGFELLCTLLICIWLTDSEGRIARKVGMDCLLIGVACRLGI